MNETYSSFGCLRQHVLREAAEIVGECVGCVDHYSLGGAGMCALSLNRHCRCSCAPCFVADLTKSLTINCISDLRSESLNIKLFDSATNFFIRSECYR